MVSLRSALTESRAFGIASSLLFGERRPVRSSLSTMMCPSLKPQNHSAACIRTAHGPLSNDSFNHLTIFGFQCLEFCSKFFYTFCCVLISVTASDWMATVRVFECSYLFEETTNCLTSPCPNVYSHRYQEKLSREKWGEREIFRHSFQFVSNGHPIIQRLKISDHKVSGLSSFL